MHTVNIHEAKTHLSAILKRVESGEDVLIARAGKPIARVSPIPASSGKRQPGSAKGKGKIIMTQAFMEPLPENILKEFEK
ncbi:MAG: type II toxin-antitoxin system Phd/YefM family antitoxin [Nitrospinae bacterium]|nr:type II toxin-antitoxin system Phd/YefM family antitoxin [Nitrospinota bacterium]